MAVPQLSFLHSYICCKGLGSNGSIGLNNKHSLEETFWHLAFTTSTVAPVRIGKDKCGSQDKQNYHCMVAGVPLEGGVWEAKGGMMLDSKHSSEEQLLHLASTTSTRAPVRWAKTSVAPKTRTIITTGWWLAWYWKNIVPLAMECQVNDEKTQIFPKTKQTWFLLGKQLATYNFAASLFCTQSPFKIILHPASWWLSHSCHSCAGVFAAKIWAQMG